MFGFGHMVCVGSLAAYVGPHERLNESNDGGVCITFRLDDIPDSDQLQEVHGEQESKGDYNNVGESRSGPGEARRSGIELDQDGHNHAPEQECRMRTSVTFGRSLQEIQ